MIEMNDIKFIEIIKDKKIYDFVKKSLEEYASEQQLEEAMAVADIVYQKFISAGYINETHQQKFVDITLAASLLFNLFYNENDITTLLKHRVSLEDIREESGLDKHEAEYIYEIIESQLGENHIIPKLKPIPNSPSSTFCDAVWYVREYKKGY